METITVSSLLISLFSTLIIAGLIKVLNWLWFRPKKLEKWFRQQGLSGTSYQFLFGDMKHYSSTRARALEHPMNGFSNDFLPRVEPLRHQLVNKFGLKLKLMACFNFCFRSFGDGVTCDFVRLNLHDVISLLMKPS